MTAATFDDLNPQLKDDWSFFDSLRGLKPENFVNRKKAQSGSIAAWSPGGPACDPTSLTGSDELEFEPDGMQEIKQNIRRRLFDLIQYSIEDNETPPRAESITGFNKFFEAVKSVQRPLLTSDSQGFLVATWRTSNSSMLSIRFLDRKLIEYAWALERGNEKIERKWGEAAWEDFVSSFPYKNAFLESGN